MRPLSFAPPVRGLFLLLLACWSQPGQAQPAVPHRAVTDAGGGTVPGISSFELFRDGIFWWKSGALASEVGRREGTLAVHANLGIRAPAVLTGPVSRYVGQGYNFSIDGAVRDDLHVYYAANGVLRRKPLASSFTDALADSTRILIDRVSGNPPRFELVPVAANGAVMLWRGDLWGSYASGGSFFIERPTGLAGLRTFSAAGGVVRRMQPVEVLQNNGSRLKDSLLVLTQDRLLYQFDLDPFNATPALLARDVWDFAVRNESTAGGGGPGGIFIGRNHTTAIYAAVGTSASSRVSGRLLRISARDRSVSVAYDTQNVDQQVRGVAVTSDRIYLTVTPLRCGGVFGCSYDDANAQILSRVSGANSDFLSGPFGTIADKLTAGGSLEGFNLRSDRRWLYWITGNSIWRIPADAKPIERDFEVLGLEVVQTTQDFDNSTRLVANKPTVARAYARLSQDTTGVGRYAVNALLVGYSGDTVLPGSPLAPVNNPAITAQGNLATLRSGLDNGFLFELPKEWIRKGRFRVGFTVNPALGVPETGQNPLRNNVLNSGDVEVVQTGSPCLVLVPIHTAAPNYDPRDPASGFGDILVRAQSLLPVDHFRFVFKGDRISRPVPKIKLSKFFIPYPAIDYEPFDVSGGFDDALSWLSLYSTFESNPRDCGDTHYVGTVHWMANTTRGGSTSLGLATRPESGVAEDLVVKMEPPGAVAGVPAWNDPRGGETLAHELGHNYRLRHIDQSMSPLACGGGRPLRAGAYPLDTCTIGIESAANVTAEMASRTTQFGFDPLTWNVIGPTNAADLMSYRTSTWLSRPSLDALFANIPGFEAPPAAALRARHGAPPPGLVVLVHGVLDLDRNTAVLRPCYRLPSETFDAAKLLASLNAPPVAHDWTIRWADAAGAALSESPLLWTRSEDGDGHLAGFVQFVQDQPGAVRLQILKGATVVAECQPSVGAPTLSLGVPTHDAASHRLTMEWSGADPEQDPLVYTLQFTCDNGATWETLQVNYPDESFAANTRLLAGGVRCRLRVIASDGFNATVVESDSFTLPPHAPEVVLSGIRDGVRLPFGATPDVTALGYDAEDGSLPPEAMEWTLSGPVNSTQAGARFSLRDLPPGAYRLSVTGTDSDLETARALIDFEIEPIDIPTAVAPSLDGDCGDVAYANASLVRMALADGRFVNGRMVHADGALHACVSDLQFSPSAAAPAVVGLRVDRRASTEVPPGVADLAGFFVDEFGIPSQKLGDADAYPETGFIAVVSRGDASWSAEWLIPDALLGGWNRQSPTLLVHAQPAAPSTSRVWPPGAIESEPSSWAASALGVAPGRTQRAPVAVTPSLVSEVAAAGDRIYLDGTGSSDPDGDVITWEWTQVGGPSVVLENATGSVPFFVVGEGNVGASHQFRLVVRDATLESAPAETTVTLLQATPAPEPDLRLTSGRNEAPGGGPRFALLWPGSAGDLCAIQASSDLVTWTEVGRSTADYLGRLRFVGEPLDQFEHRFYRAIAAPAFVPGEPRGAISLDGVDDSVTVAHRSSLNAFPLTLAAWIRTSRSGPMVDGVISKYADGSFNGYGLFVYFGRIRAFYFGSVGGSVWGGGQGLDGGPVADGEWHHVAFAVDAGGGRLVVDGVQTAALPWVGIPGAPTTTEPLRMGRYHTYPNAFLGDLDEIGVWNAGLTNGEIGTLSGVRWNAVEDDRALGFWHFDEQEGVSTVDASAEGNLGVLQGGAGWTTSPVPR